MNSWTKRAIGVAALAGGLLALGGGTASADEASTSGSVRIGSAPTAEVRLCGGGAALSGLLGRCGGQAGSDSGSTTVQAGDNRVRVQVPGVGSAGGSLATRPQATVSGPATVDLAASATAEAAADTSPRVRATADVGVPDGVPDVAGPSTTAKVTIMLAREGAADGVDAAATVDLIAPPASADAALAVGGEEAAAAADAALAVGGEEAAAAADATLAVGLSRPAERAAADADAAVVVGGEDAAATAADATLAVGHSGLAVPALDRAVPNLPALDGAVPSPPAPVGGVSLDGLLAAIDPPVLGVGDLVPSTPATVCVGDCGQDTSPGGTSSPPPAGDGSGGQDTSTGGIVAPDQPSETGQTGTSGMLAGAAGAAGTAGTTGATLARLRSALGGGSGGALAFTGGASDLRAIVALGLLMVGASLLRASRPACLGERR